MANPYADKVKSTSSAKFKSMTGKKSSGQGHPDESQDKSLFKKMVRNNEYKVGGAVSPSRADKFARGGKAKGKGKKGTHINIAVIAPGGKDKEPGGPLLPPGLPPGGPMAMPPPPGPGGGPGGPMPPGMPPMQRGGKVAMKGGSETGQGRLDKIKAYGSKAKHG